MYELQKLIWSQHDFDVMGWHDATIHAFALVPEQFELLLDIDYILKWEEPEPPDVYHTFWVSPATLVFQGVQDIKINLDIDNIQDIDYAELFCHAPILILSS